MRRVLFANTFSTILLFILTAACQALSASAAEIEPATKIQNIIVYSDSAMIKKEARFTLKKGENIIRIPGITPYLSDQSLQVKLSSKSAVKISEVQIEKTSLRKTSQEKMDKLKARLDAIDEPIKKSLNELSVISSADEFIKKLSPFAQNQKVSQAEVEAYAKFLEKSLTENNARKFKAEFKLKKLQEEKTAVEKEIKALNTPDNSKQISITIFAKDDIKEATLDLSYIVKNAGWTPLYEVRADSSTSKIEFSSFATIKQATGEDWNDVDVEVSTAKPYNTAAPADLTAWNIDIYKPRTYPAYRSAKEELMSISKSAQALETDKQPFEETQIKAETTSFSFVIPQKISIPADNQQHRVLLAAIEKKTDFSYFAIPKLSGHAYLKADFKNPFAFPLLHGRMNLFLDSRLTSTSFTGKTFAPDEDMRLSLGIDESITVTRKLQRKFTGYSGLFTKGIKINYEYLNEIKNNKNKAVAISVIDNVPISLNEKIKVSLETPKKEETYITAEGIITWKLNLASGEKMALPLKFRVEHPKEIKVSGLE
ncbi:MAG: mucoidy inhibitor MuiA family protein [Nitrospirae bacterium]|nr:mucoidy inhibitor MuiA family protein [Nitrospirota bacterium]